MRLKDKVAIVTGSSKGIGEGIARIFHQEGAMVVVVGRNVDAGLKMARELGSEEGRSIFVKTDVRKSQEIREMIDKTVATFGKIDIVVNNVGYHISKNAVETSEKEWGIHTGDQPQEYFLMLKVHHSPFEENQRQHH